VSVDVSNRAHIPLRGGALGGSHASDSGVVEVPVVFVGEPRYGILGTQDTLEETKPVLRCLPRIIDIRDNKIGTTRYTYLMCVDNQDGDNTI
jgi:hypothetical protein